MRIWWNSSSQRANCGSPQKLLLADSPSPMNAVSRRSKLRALLYVLPAIFLAFLLLSQSAMAYYYPPTQTPPGPPPNYNQVDTTNFLGVPILPVPGPASDGGIYIYYDAGKWTIANHIFSKGGSLEQFHGSILAVMEQPPQMGVNVFVTDFELWEDTTANRCLSQNDRWGWVQWNDSLYEIWWDVTTKEYKPEKSQVDVNDFLEFCIVGCAIDFNIWSSGHNTPFDASQIYLGAPKAPLSTIAGFTDTFAGITDPYQSQAGSQPDKNPNITIFTNKALPGASFNRLGLITPADSYVCDATYGARYAGTFAYEGNGVQFSTNCDEPENQLPNLFPEFESTVFVCGSDSSCFIIIGSDPDVGDTVTLTLIQGPISFTPQTAPTMITDTLCFLPDTSGLYTFIWQVADASGQTATDTMLIAVTVNSPPISNCPSDTSIFQCSAEEICIGPFTCTDVDHNLDSCGAPFGTFVGHTCFGGANVRPDPSTSAAEMTTLQNFFDTDGQIIDVFADQSSAALFQTGDSGVSSFELHLEMAGFAAQNKFGVYSCGIPDTLYEIFAGSNVVGHTATASFNEGGVFGKLVVRRFDASSTLLDSSIFFDVNASSFGFYLQSPANGGSTFYSEDVQNTDSVTQCVAFAGTGVRSNGFWLGWEDLDRALGGTDDDFNDMLVFVDVVSEANGCRGFVCFTPDTSGVYDIIWNCQDACGAVTSCTTAVTVELNSAPVASCPANDTVAVCDLSSICLPGFGATDAEGNLASVFVDNGTLTAGSVCFTPVAGVNTITLIATDSCGLADTCITTITVNANGAPVATCPAADTVFVCDLSALCLPGFSGSDADGNLLSVSVVNGTLSNDTVCFTPVAGSNIITLIATDSCGVADTCVATVEITVNSAPVVVAPADTSVFLCNVGDTICTPPWPETDIDGNKTGFVINIGWGDAGGICFIPDTAGVYLLECCASDDCGAVGCDTMLVTVSFNSPPVATCPADTAFTLCAPEQVCVASFGGSDPDGNLMSTGYNIGTATGDSVCFTPDTAGVYSIICTLQDSCGAVTNCTTKVTINYIPAPVIADQSFETMICDAATVCYVLPAVTGGLAPFAFTADGLAVTDSVCISLTANGVVTRQIIVTDACGKVDTSALTINATVNGAPQITAADTASVFICTSGDSVFVPFSVVDPDNGLSGISNLGIVSMADSTVRFKADTSGLYCDQLIISDSCGLPDTLNYCIAVTINSAPTISCAPDESFFLCASQEICVGPFGSGDVDGNVASVSYNLGTPSGSNICFTPDTAGVYTLICTIVDSCGASASCTTSVTVAFNSAPTVSCANDTSVTLCSPEEICVGAFTAADSDGNLATISAGFGTITGSNVCFTPDTAGVYTIIWTAADSCNASAACTTTVTVGFIPAPVIADQSFNIALCDTATQCFALPAVTGGLAPFTFTSNGVAVTDSVCHLLEMNTNITYQIIVTDACGKVDTASLILDATVNSAPQVTIAASSTTFTCNVGDTVCTKFSVIDPDNGLSGVSNLGWVNMSDSTVCFVAGDTSGVYCDQITISDSCGLTDVDNYCVTITLNSPPTVSCPPAKSFSLCGPEEVCVGPFSSGDPDNNIASISYSFGTSSGSNICFTPDTAGIYILTCIIIDSCGSADTCSTDVTVDFFAAPVLPQDQTISGGFLCSAGQECFARPSASGGKAPLTYSVSGDCQLIDDQICVNLASGSNSKICTLTVVDDCGNTDSQIITYTAEVNTPPTVSCNASFSVTVCDPAAIICVDGFGISDGNGNIASISTNFGTISGSTVCFTPGAAGTFNVTVTATDSCGASSSCTTEVTVIQEAAIVCDGCPTITLEKAHNILQGEQVCLSITSEGSARPFGGYDLLVAYDNSALVALGANPGSFIEGCGWEYFTYRFGANGNCSGGCPSGLLRVVALADINDGLQPICFGPGTTDAVELAEICFSVSNDRTLECQFAPVRFFWVDCGDNTLSDKTGDTLFVSETVFDFGNPTPINDGSAGFPTFLGTQPSCLVGGGPGKPNPLPCLTFQNGGVDIICADSIDGRGDLNLNGVDNEIADAVMFTEYFVSGLSAFSPHEAGSIAASEVNGDGIPLTVADLVYLIRVIVGDALPLAKLTHDAAPVTLKVTDGVISSEVELGAALFVFEGLADVTLLQSHMSLTIGHRGGNTFALVSPNLNNLSNSTERIEVGDIVSSSTVLLSASASNVEGAVVDVSTSAALPTSFTLQQNYPNPFNPSTKIDFTLPGPMAYNLTIYNVAGQKVKEFSGASEGSVTVTWEASEVGSGLYFYKLTAGNNVATRKMVLLK